MIKYTFTLLVFLAVLPVFAQKEMKKAEKFYYDLKITSAIVYYKKAYTKNPTLEAAKMLAICNTMVNNTNEAVYWFEKVMTYRDYEPAFIKYYADALKKKGEYVKAESYYIKYSEAFPSEGQSAIMLAESCKKAAQWMAEAEPFEITKEEGLNGENSDFCPVLYGNGIVITSDRSIGSRSDINGWTGTPYYGLFFLKKEKNGWSKAKEINLNNSEEQYHQGPGVFSPKGDTIYFTRVSPLNKKVLVKANHPNRWQDHEKNKFISRSELFYAIKEGKNWSVPIALAFNDPLNYSVGHPALSADGSILYFASDMPGGLGQSDLYYCEKKADGTWGSPINAGEKINTSGMEMFPVVSKSGKLYFSSDGHPGLGGLDIFSASGEKNNWDLVNNLKFPLNTPADDFGILWEDEGKAGFLSSGRDSENGKDHIFYFSKKERNKTFILAGKTIREDNRLPITGVLLDIIETDTKAVTVKEILSDAEGNFFVEALKGVDYIVNGVKNGYKETSVKVTGSLTGPDTLEITLVLDAQIILTNNFQTKEYNANTIYFDLDKFNLTLNASEELDKIALVMLDNEDARIELSAHCDARAGSDYNFRLSQKRAKSAVDYLIGKGIDKSRISAMAYGKTRLVNKCLSSIKCPEEEHRLNRRVEIKLIFEHIVPAKYTDKENEEIIPG
jgi:outer membrane protein OmpA-like peptidoglycan-associated protein/tetratricopeptide (TPR) repeat protein